jgi:phosphatidylserine decarboxylase
MSVATFAAAQLLRALPRTRMSRAVGKLCDARLPPFVSSAVVQLYVRAYGVDLAQCIPPSGGYSSFDEFFTRELVPGARPIAGGEREVVSPADGRLEARGTVDPEGSLMVKGRSYRVAELLGDDADARRYAGGQFALFYLSPRDYHRVHAPIEGWIVRVRSMPGDLFPVNAIGERHIPSLFAKNRRVAISIETASAGRVTAVMVGAMIVGRITVSAMPGQDVPLGDHVIPRAHVAPGDEIGIFHLGSSVILFAEPGAVPPWTRAVGPVLLGQSLTEVS